MTLKQVADKNYQLEKNGLSCKVSFTLPSNEIKQLYNNKINKLSVNYRAPGVRPGNKYTRIALERTHGTSILQEVTSELADDWFKKMLDDEKLAVAGTPNVDLSDVKSDSDVSLTAEFECMPDVELKSINEKALKKPIVELSKQDVEDKVNKLLEEHTTWKSKKTESVSGDQVVVTYTGTIDGESFDGGSAEKSPLVAGEGKMLPEFEAALIGAKKGEKKEIKLSFPKDYMEKKLVGKKAVFAINIDEVNEPVKPKLGKALFKKLGSEATSVSEFKKELAEKSNEECDWIAKRIAHKNVLKIIENMYDFEVPKSLTDNELEVLRKENKEKSDEDILNEAKSNIRMSLVLQKHANEMNIKVDDTMVEEYLKKIAPDFLPKDMFINWYKSDKERYTKVQVAVIEQEVVGKLLLQYAKKEDKMTISDAKKLLDIKE